MIIAVDPRVEIIVRVITDWGGATGDGLHSWRCQYPERYGQCDCLADVAQEICDALGAP